MTIVTGLPKKPIPVIRREVVNSLDNLHRSIAEVMAERGEITITDTPESGKVIT